MADTLKVSDWMSKKVLTVEPFDSIATARRIMAKNRVNQLPVLDGDRLVGIVTDRDIRDAYPTSMMIHRTKEIDRFANSYTVEAVMTFNVITVGPDTPLAHAVSLLRRHRVGSLPVMEKDRLVGIITRSDILDFVLSGQSLAPRAGGAPPRSRAARSKHKEKRS
ncbi:MAG TPA: CBS domain-containing protein [Candidatus Acidoferrales bacterium]|nr:CBS domain-containing protein [Candidatus Acidoferrales bacterium]